MVDNFWLSEAQFGRISQYLPRDTRGVARVDDRRVISGIIHVLQTGCRWKDAPEIYGPRKTLYNRFVRWAEKGVWDILFDQLGATEALTAALTTYGYCINSRSSMRNGQNRPIRGRLTARLEGGQAQFAMPPINAGSFEVLNHKYKLQK